MIPPGARTITIPHLGRVEGHGGIHVKIVGDVVHEVDLDNDSAGNYVFETSRQEGLLSYTVPTNVLNRGQTNSWGVRAVDARNWDQIQNSSNTPWGVITFTVEEDPKRLDYFEVAVWNGLLDADFGVLPGFRNKLVSAVLSMPNPAHPSYEFVLPQGAPGTDWKIWDTECRYLVWWEHAFGAPQPADYGQYTLTLTFSDGAQEVYTKTLDQVPVTPPAITGGSVNADGGVDVSWNRQTTADQYYQVRVRNTAGKEYCRLGPWLNAEAASLSPYDLRCLEEGITYRWLVRAYDDVSPDYNTFEAASDLGEYSPALLVWTSYSDWLAMAFRGELDLSFDVRPGSSTHLTGATVTGPNGFTYARRAQPEPPHRDRAGRLHRRDAAAGGGIGARAGAAGPAPGEALSASAAPLRWW